MTTINAITGYKTSRDYRQLFHLMQKSSIICIIDYPHYLRHDGSRPRDIAHTLYRNGDYQISNRGHGYIWAETEDDFVSQCSARNVEFIEPQGLGS